MNQLGHMVVFWIGSNPESGVMDLSYMLFPQMYDSDMFFVLSVVFRFPEPLRTTTTADCTLDVPLTWSLEISKLS